MTLARSRVYSCILLVLFTFTIIFSVYALNRILYINSMEDSIAEFHVIDGKKLYNHEIPEWAEIQKKRLGEQCLFVYPISILSAVLFLILWRREKRRNPHPRDWVSAFWEKHSLAVIVAVSIILVAGVVTQFIIANITFDRPQHPKPIYPPQVTEATPHPAEVSTVLELGWGKGDYQVGYINDKYRKTIEELPEEKEEPGYMSVGPHDFCVDGDEGIYINDIMNNRFIKYDREGVYQGQVDKGLFLEGRPNEDTGTLQAIGGPDCIYVYDQFDVKEHYIYRYRFQDEELKKLDISDIHLDWGRAHP